MKINKGPATHLQCVFLLPAYILRPSPSSSTTKFHSWDIIFSLAGSFRFWGGTFESNLRIFEEQFEDFTKRVTRQINLIVCKGAHFIQIHCFKGAHSTLSDIQFEGHIWGFYRGHILNPKSAKSRHLPDLRQKRVCYQSNVPPQTAMCLPPWGPWGTLLRTGNSVGNKCWIPV